LYDKVQRAVNPINQNDEVLWNELITAFDSNFADTTKEQKAYNVLQQLRMADGALDTYISIFKQLAKKAGYEFNEKGTLNLFANGLTQSLYDAIMSRDNTPTTFNEWVAAAQKETQKYADKIAMRPPRGRTQGPFYRTSQKHHRQQQQSHIHPNDRTVPMDVDPPSFSVNKAYTEEQKNKHRAEGRCFNCDRQGHMARECPYKKRQQFGSHTQASNFQRHPPKKSYSQGKGTGGFRKRNKFPRQQQLQVRSAYIEEVPDEQTDLQDTYEEEEEDPIPNLAVRTSRLSDEHKEKFLAELQALGVDF
jgi:hypothetical protein